MEVSYFDKAAPSYDETFTNSYVARQQRLKVWSYLDSFFNARNTALNILELNCGTGEDAVWMAQRGHQVVATDVSKRMIEATGKKMVLEGLSDKIETKILDLNYAEDIGDQKQYDLIFSNFGGLNCLKPEAVEALAAQCKKCLKPDGMLVFVVMPKLTKIDSWYRLIKLKWKSRAERRKGFTEVNVEGTSVPCYYYNSKELASRVKGFKIKDQMIIGFIPSYFDKTLSQKPWLLSYLENWEKEKYEDLDWIDQSDHYLMSFEHE